MRTNSCAALDDAIACITYEPQAAFTICALRKGENPFNPELLEALRKGDVYLNPLQE